MLSIFVVQLLLTLFDLQKLLVPVFRLFFRLLVCFLESIESHVQSIVRNFLGKQHLFLTVFCYLVHVFFQLFESWTFNWRLLFSPLRTYFNSQGYREVLLGYMLRDSTIGCWYSS